MLPNCATGPTVIPLVCLKNTEVKINQTLQHPELDEPPTPWCGVTSGGPRSCPGVGGLQTSHVHGSLVPGGGTGWLVADYSEH